MGKIGHWIRQFMADQRGVFDMPSMVAGAVIVGILSTAMIGTVLLVIPIGHDKAAQQDLLSVKTAQGVQRSATRAEGDPSYGGLEELISAGYLASGDRLSVGVTDSGRCFTAVAQSKTGKLYWLDSSSSEPEMYRESDRGICGNLPALVDSFHT